MYEFLEAIALPRGVGESWEVADLGSSQCTTIVKRYSEAYILLRHPVLTETQVLKLSAVSSEVSGFTGTFSEWLVSNGNKTLPTTPGTFELQSGMANCMDAVYAGYNILGHDASRHPDTELTEDQQTDLLLRRKNVDYEAMGNHVLATVNGLFHRAGSSAYGYVVYDGGRSANHANGHNVGLLSFQHVSGFKCHNIERSWFTKPLPLLDYKDQFYLKTPVSMFGKSVALVIAGFLLLPGEEFTKINDNTLSVNWNRLSMLDRYRIADRQLDLRDRVTLEILPDDDRRVGKQMMSDEFVMQMCTLPQSFLILFDEPSITIEREKLESLRIPGRWMLHRRPQGLLQVDYGFSPEYTVSAQRENHYVLQAHPQYQRTALGSTVRRNLLKVQDDSHHGATEFRTGQGHLLMFSSERVIVKAA